MNYSRFIITQVALVLLSSQLGTGKLIHVHARPSLVFPVVLAALTGHIQCQADVQCGGVPVLQAEVVEMDLGASM